MTKKILIEGMSCGHCVKHVEEALSGLNAVTYVDVKLESKTAVIEVQQDVSDEDIRLAIEEAGYEVVGIESI
jgi:copper ion binding protein